MAPDAPEREPEMQDTPPCQSSSHRQGASLWVPWFFASSFQCAEALESSNMIMVIKE